MNQFFTKNTNSKITSIDTENRVITGYASVFGVIDSDGDMIMPGAFTKTLNENSKRIRHLLQHDVRYPLAKPDLKEDSFGLYFTSTISDTSFGRDTIRLYNDGVIDEHSIGFNTIKNNKRENYWEITEVRLWEISSVTWGANALAIGGPAKSMDKEDIIKRMDTIYKAIRHGKYESDDIFERLDIYYQQLKQLIFDLASTPAAKEAPEPVQVKDKDDSIIETKLDNILKLFIK